MSASSSQRGRIEAGGGLSWWTDALAGKLPQITQEPQCGYFRRKLVKGGPDVAARIWWDGERDESGWLIGDETLRCEVDGKICDAEDQWTWLAGNPITIEEWKYLSARRSWAERHSPDDPFADPTTPIDWLNTRIPF